MKIATTLCLALTLALRAGSTAAAPPAAASTPESDKAQAQALLREGNGLLRLGRAAEALSKFTEAYGLVPSPKLHYNLGQAASAIPGREAQAFEELSLFLDEAKDAGAELRAAAETKRQQLRGKVGLVTVTATPADADLTVDGTAVAKEARSRPLILIAGAHRLSLDRGPVAYGVETVTVAGGETLEVRLGGNAPASTIAAAPAALEPTASTPAPATGLSATRTAVAEPGWSWQRKLGVGLGAAAAASLVFAIVESINRELKAGDFRDAGCGTQNLMVGDSCQGLYGEIQDAERLLTVGYIGAAVLGGAAATFFFLSPTSSAAPSAASGPAGSAGTAVNGMTFNLRGRF